MKFIFACNLGEAQKEEWNHFGWYITSDIAIC